MSGWTKPFGRAWPAPRPPRRHYPTIADRVRLRLDPGGSIHQAIARDLSRYYDALEAIDVPITPELMAALTEVDPPDATASERLAWPDEALSRIVRSNLHIVYAIDVDQARRQLLALTTLEFLALLDWRRRMEIETTATSTSPVVPKR
jgi:hypothetical protein